MTKPTFHAALLKVIVTVALLPTVAGAATTSTTTVFGMNSGDNFGDTVASVGDINNDGLSDYAVSAQYNDASGTDKGAVYIYYGSTTREHFTSQNLADVTIMGDSSDGYRTGFNVTSGGDLNADGYNDVLVSRGGDTGDTAQAYAFFGPLAGTYSLSTADVTFNMGSPYNPTAYVANAGDLNGDGYTDVAISEPSSGSFGAPGASGYVYIYSGPFIRGSNLTTTDATASISGYYHWCDYYGCTTSWNGADYLGTSVVSLGDMNADGYGDVAISAYNRDRVYIFEGPLTGSLTYSNATAELTLAGASYLGHNMTNVGDMNADGINDLAISDFGANSNTGAVYVVYGPFTSSMDLATSSDLILTGVNTGDKAGYSTAALGDVSGDGYGDLAIGAPYNDTASTDAGALYVIPSRLANGTYSVSRFPKRLGKTAGDAFGYSVASLGDVDGDGFSDMLVGSPFADNRSMVDAGIATVFFSR